MLYEVITTGCRWKRPGAAKPNYPPRLEEIGLAAGVSDEGFFPVLQESYNFV